MRMSSRVDEQPGGRKMGFIRADMASYSCSTSSRLTRDATSTSWKVLLPFLSRRFINIGGSERLGGDRRCGGSESVAQVITRKQRGDAPLQWQASVYLRDKGSPPSTTNLL